MNLCKQVNLANGISFYLGGEPSMATYIPTPINIDDLVDIQDIVIDKTLPVSEKKKEYHKQIKNPECFRFGDTIVRISYAKSGPPMKDLLQQYLLSGQHTQLLPQAPL